jgi:hypothetical protein
MVRGKMGTCRFGEVCAVTVCTGPVQFAALRSCRFLSVFQRARSYFTRHVQWQLKTTDLLFTSYH